MNTNVDI